MTTALATIPARAIEIPSPDIPCALGLNALREQAPESSWAICVDGAVIGYSAVIPGEPGFCHGSVYLAPSARSLGNSLKMHALEIGRRGIAEAVSRGYLAIAGNPTSDGLLRYGLALGFAPSGVDLPMRGPVLIRRLRAEADAIDPADIARRCFPGAFAMAAHLAELMADGPIPLLPVRPLLGGVR